MLSRFALNSRYVSKIIKRSPFQSNNNGYLSSISDCFISTNNRFYSSTDSKVGLFSLDLHQPKDFLDHAKRAMQECNTLRETIRNSLDTNALSPRETLLHLDEISNKVCSVIDASELCRSVHASAEWRNAASSAFQILSEYIAELNADTALYQSLVPITSNPEIMQNLTEEERRMAILLQKEFERDAIHLSDKERERVQQLNSFVVQLETMFTENLVHHKSFELEGPLVDDVYKTIPKSVICQNIQQNNSRDESVTLTTEPHIANSLLKYSQSANLRREIFMEANTACPQNLDVLDALIKQRHELAQAMGYPSYAHYFLSDKMAMHPDNVMKFLHNVKNASQQQYNHDMQTLSMVKSQIEGTTEELKPWDLSHYTGIVKSHLFEGQDDAGSLAGYFTVDQTLEGFKDLVQRLFGITMTKMEMNANETWDVDGSGISTLRKYEFVEEKSGKPLGCVYFDLHPRPNKYTHAAHFTVRCGCEVFESRSSGEAVYQLPIVALVCNLSPPYAGTGSASILSHSEVETLTHEFGHCLHSLLSRTSFQHLSGTRAAMDFVETPSHLLEYYVWDKQFLQKIGSHYESGESIPEGKIDNLIKSKNSFQSLEIQSQCVYAMFDQIIFGQPENWQGSTTDLFRQLHRGNGIMFAEGTHWHSKFSHLVSYGAGYYSYLYASIFSADIWATCFQDGATAFDKNIGEKYWKEILVHGGSKDPNQMLRSMLGREPDVSTFFNRLLKSV